MSLLTAKFLLDTVGERKGEGEATFDGDRERAVNCIQKQPVSRVTPSMLP
jgi:hypothetical protein